jgi:hypothetical protein
LAPVSHTTLNGELEVCYNSLFESKPGGPTTAQFLVMFDEHFVEHCGCIYAAPDYEDRWGDAWSPFRGRRGLYAVTDVADSACVKFGLLFQDQSIGQIVASTQFDPIGIIGLSGNEIYGYYVHNGVYKREKTVWGNAKPWSLSAEPVEGGLVSGIASDGHMFRLWGSFDPDSTNPADKNFNLAKFLDEGIKCASTPAHIDDWTGSLSGLRGTYCPSEETGQLWKNTWNADPTPSTYDQLNGPFAEKVRNMLYVSQKRNSICSSKANSHINKRNLFIQIARLGPNSNIYGISTDKELLTLDDATCSDSAGVCSIAIAPVEFTLVDDYPGQHSNPYPNPRTGSALEISALGGLGASLDQGVFVVNGDCGLSQGGEPCEVYNVYFENGWKAKELVYFTGTNCYCDGRGLVDDYECGRREIKEEISHGRRLGGGCYKLGDVSIVRFGSFNGKVYVLEGISFFGSALDHYVHELTFEGGNKRYNDDIISSGTVW